MHRFKTYIKLFYFFPGTYLHEIAHYLPALLFANGVSMSVIPSFKRGTAGEVSYSEPRFSAAKTIISLAPLLWWGVLLWMLAELHILIIEIDGLKLYALLQYNPTLSAAQYLLAGYTFMQLVWAGTLSRKDWENAIDGLVSLSGFAVVMAGFVVWFYWSDIAALTMESGGVLTRAY